MNFIAEKICKAQTVAELTALENQHTLNEFEQGLTLFIPGCAQYVIPEQMIPFACAFITFYIFPLPS
jgi:hypothetical protein